MTDLVMGSEKNEVIARILGCDTPPELAVFGQCETWDGVAIEQSVATLTTRRVVADEQVSSPWIATRKTQPLNLELEVPIRRLTVESKADARVYATSTFVPEHGE